jgi:hypothetical protein
MGSDLTPFIAAMISDIVAIGAVLCGIFVLLVFILVVLGAILDELRKRPGDRKEQE